MTTLYIDGFEHQSVSASPTGPYDAAAYVLVETDTKRTGTAALNVATDARNTYVRKDIANTQSVAASLYVRFPSSFDFGSTTLFSLYAGSNLVGRIGLTTGSSSNFTRAAGDNTPTTFGPNLSVNTWYRLDVKVVSDSSTWTITVQVDGANEATNSDTGKTATNMTRVYIGPYEDASPVQNFLVDDLVVTDDDADYPIGVHTVEGLKLTADGTHNVGTNQFRDAGGTYFTNSSTDGYQDLDDASTDGTTTYIRQSTNGSTNYMECTFADLATGDYVPYAVYARGMSQDSLATSSTGVTRLRDSVNGADLSPDLRSSSDDPGVTWTLYQDLITAPGGGWTRTIVNGLRYRFGFRDGYNGEPRFASPVVEVWMGPSAAQDADVTTTTVASSTTVPTPTVSGRASPTGTTIAAAVSIPGVVVSASADIDLAGAIAGTTSIPAVGITAGGNTYIFPDPIAATVSIPALMVLPVNPATIAAQAGVPTPVVTVTSPNAYPAPSTVGVVTTIPTPTVTAELGAAISPTSVQAFVAIPTPVVVERISALPVPATIVATTTVPGCIVGGDAKAYSPPPLHARIGEIGFSLQTAEGAAAATPDYIMGVADVLPMPRQNTTPHAPAHASLVTQTLRKGMTYWEVMSTVPAYPSGIGVPLKAILSSESVSGSDPYDHVFTPGTTDEWLTLFSTRPGPLYEKYTDGLVEQVMLTFETGRPLQMLVSGKGRSATILADPYTPGASDDDVLTMVGASLRFDWASAAVTPRPHVEFGSVRVFRRLTVHPTADEAVPLGLTRGPLEAEVQISMALEDYVGYYTTFMGSLTGTSQSSNVVTGELDLTFHAITTPATRYLRVEFPAVAFLWDPPQPDLTGGAPRVSLTGYAVRASDGSFCTATLRNAVAGSY